MSEPRAARAIRLLSRLLLAGSALLALAIGAREAVFARVAVLHAFSILALAPAALLFTALAELVAVRHDVRGHRGGLYAALAVALVAPSVFGALGIWARPYALRRAAERGQPIVRALWRYQKDHGHPPELLNELVPAYLPSLPTPGLPGKRAFDYVYDDGSPREPSESPLECTPWVTGEPRQPRWWLYLARQDVLCAEMYGFRSDRGRWEML